MNQRRQRLRASPTPLWQRILGRHKYKGRLLRPRVPLVLRIWRLENQHGTRTVLQPQTTQYALSLHLQLAWPFVSVRRTAFSETHQHSANFTRSFLWLTPGRTSLQADTPATSLIN